MDNPKLQRNIATRKAAEGFLTSARTFLEIETEIDPDRFWELLAQQAAAHVGMLLVPDGPEHKRMSDEEARRFEDEMVPFGKYKGERIGDVDPKYWVTVIESQFNSRLRLYMRSKRFKERQ